MSAILRVSESPNAGWRTLARDNPARIAVM